MRKKQSWWKPEMKLCGIRTTVSSNTDEALSTFAFCQRSLTAIKISPRFPRVEFSLKKRSTSCFFYVVKTLQECLFRRSYHETNKISNDLVVLRRNKMANSKYSNTTLGLRCCSLALKRIIIWGWGSLREVKEALFSSSKKLFRFSSFRISSYDWMCLITISFHSWFRFS